MSKNDEKSRTYGDPGWALDDVGTAMRRGPGRVDYGWSIAVDLVAHIRELELFSMDLTEIADEIDAAFDLGGEFNDSSDALLALNMAKMRLRKAFGVVR